MPTEKENEMKLLPCPFCGKAPAYSERAECITGNYWPEYVQCSGCRILFRRNEHETVDPVERWNRRANIKESLTTQAEAFPAVRRTPTFCTACGTWGHTSGGCPAIVKDALNSPVTLPAEAVEKIREALESCESYTFEGSHYKGFRSDLVSEALALLPPADTGKGME